MKNATNEAMVQWIIALHGKLRNGSISNNKKGAPVPLQVDEHLVI